MLEKLAKTGTLDISGSTFFNNYSEKEFEQIMLELEDDDKTTSVIIKDRNFSENDFAALCKMIEKNKSIGSLDLSQAKFSLFTNERRCALKLKNPLNKNTTLKTLIADDCSFNFTYAILAAIHEVQLFETECTINIANLSLCGAMLTKVESKVIKTGALDALIYILLRNTSFKTIFLSKVGFNDFGFELTMRLFDGLARSSSPLEQLYFSYEEPISGTVSFSITSDISDSICAILRKPTLSVLLLPHAKLSYKEDSKFLDNMLTTMEDNTDTRIIQFELGNNSFPEPQHLRLQKILARNLLLTAQKNAAPNSYYNTTTTNISIALKEVESDQFENAIFHLYKINIDAFTPILHESIGLLFYLASSSKNDASHYVRSLTSSAVHLVKSRNPNDDLVFENAHRVLERINILLPNLAIKANEIDWTKHCEKEINLKNIEAILPKLKLKKFKLLQKILAAVETFKKSNFSETKPSANSFFVTKPLLFSFYNIIIQQPDIDIQLLWQQLVKNDTQQEISPELAEAINNIFSKHENAFVEIIMPTFSSDHKIEHNSDESCNNN